MKNEKKHILRGECVVNEQKAIKTIFGDQID